MQPSAHDQELCNVFTGMSGAVVVGGLTSLAFVTYCVGYDLRRYHFTKPDGSPKEDRPPIVFMLDLSKLGAGQVL